MRSNPKSFLPLIVATIVGATAVGGAQAEELFEADDDEQRPRIVMMRAGPDMAGGGFANFDLQPRMLERLSEQLALTPKQLGKFTEYAAEARPQMRQMREELSAQSQRLRQLSPGDASFERAANEAANKIGELTARMAKQSAELRAKMWKEMTPEQRSKWQAMQTERRAERVEFVPRGERGDRPVRRIEIERRIERRQQ